MTTYFIIPCGAAKASAPSLAADLYTGSMFKFALSSVRAEAEATPGDVVVLILSALHGLVALDDVVAPYDLRMGQAGSITPEALRVQAALIGMDDADSVYTFLPAAYLAAIDTALRPLFINVQDVYEAAPGIGYHRGALASLAKV